MKIRINNLEYTIARYIHKVKASRLDGLQKIYYYKIVDNDFIFNRKLFEKEILDGNEIIELEIDENNTETIDLSNSDYFFYAEGHTLTFTVHIHDLEWVHSGKVNQWKKEE